MEIIAHRGITHDYIKENTLEAFKNAINNKRLSRIYAEENGYIQGQSFSNTL